MVAYCENRDLNGLQMENGVTMFASGVSNRVNEYLQWSGLSVDRDTVLRAFDTLTECAEKKIAGALHVQRSMRPLICFDNVDMDTRIHHKRVEKNCRMFHGAWAYLHMLPPHLDSPTLAASASLPSFLDCMHNARDKPVDLHQFYPDNDAREHWVQTQKAQLAGALLEYLVAPLLADKKKTKPILRTQPPPVDPIQMYKPEILITKLMSASDNSAQGVGEFVEQLCRQLAMDAEAFSSAFQVFEGDVGSCRLFECLRMKRFPAGNEPESLKNVLTMAALAHILWNYGLAIWSHHEGNTRDSRDTGAWRTWTSLGGQGTQLPSKRDFTQILVMMRKVHTAGLIFCLE